MSDHRKGAPNETQGDGEGSVEPHIGELILGALAGLRYGSVEVVVHDGKVVQIDKRERLRLDKQRLPETRGHSGRA